MNANSASFITSVYDISRLPFDRPFVAFAGRSNVGKSSAVNALLDRKNLARVSSKPGKTASINLYDPGDKFYIADLPGYGFAKVSKSVKREWGELMEGFFASPAEIKLVVHFVDIRHEPQVTDIELTRFLAETGLPFCTVFTKADKVSKSEAEKNAERNTKILRSQLKGTFANMLAPVIFSAEKKQGTDILRALIEQLASV
ncbi:MAG: YihA family ribosome biogenesis GTP-binding protein [Clostridia bacterium]|nr:YihA family ribosome biogenesis GTP-binding protein [Clostridia bacterium]